MDYKGYESGIMVEAIEDGKIVRVSKDYALREGLLILRNAFASAQSENTSKKKFDDEVEGSSNFIETCSFLKKKGQDETRELIPCFHWTISQVRRKKNLTRGQLAQMLGVNVQQLKLIENGVLPKNGLMLIRKIEEVLGVRLRKDNVEVSQPMRQLVEEQRERKEEKEEKNENIFGDEIEIEED